MKKITYINGFSGSDGEFIPMNYLPSEELELFKTTITNRFLASFGMELKSEYRGPTKEMPVSG